MGNPITTRNPDCLLAKGTHAGFEYEVVNNGNGFRCGYIRLPPSHPWHGVSYDSIDAEVHGGLSFAAPDFLYGVDGTDDAW